ncbi:MAG: ribosomal L7Ae/L30e/S12e/Gadd45 family protein [Gemmatimonadota bacterium]
MPRQLREAEALGLLGLARRAGALVPGVGGTRRAADAGELGLAILAGDASAAQLEKVRGTLRRCEVPIRWVAGRLALGEALGGAPLSAVGVRSGSFATPLRDGLPENPPDRPGGAESKVAQELERGGKHAGS